MFLCFRRKVRKTCWRVLGYQFGFGAGAFHMTSKKKKIQKARGNTNSTREELK